MIDVRKLIIDYILPVLSKAENFEFVGAFTPNKEKRIRICNEYRIKVFDSIKDLAKECDAAFVHTSTESHYDVVKELLELGLHVYVDKPLASTVKQGEELIELSKIKNLKLMVGFNRRFSPMYKKIKDESGEIISINICKHASNSIRDVDFSETLIDDYIHHFIDCVENDLKPLTSGKEALKAQRLLENIINFYKKQ
ncbi:Gfo/Idh/MocA family protein [Clostridium sp. B9]